MAEKITSYPPKDRRIIIVPNDGYGGEKLTSLINRLIFVDQDLDAIKEVLQDQLNLLPTGGNTTIITNRINGLRLPKNGDYTALNAGIERILGLITQKLPPTKE